MANTKVTGDLIASGTITAANLVSGTLDTLLDGYLTTNTYATQSYVTTAVNNLIAAAPASLDTLNELAAALNDDANFATTVTNSLATKLNLSGGTLTGALTVNGDITSSANEGKLILNSTATNGKQYQFISIDTGNLGLYDGTAYRLWVGGSGNIGIGTTSPSEKLHVNSGAGNVPALFESTDNLSLITFKDNNTTTDVGIGADDNDEVFYAGGSERLRIYSDGNVQMQTPGAQFRLQNTVGPAPYLANAGTGNQDLFISAGGEERMRIDSSGRVLIGKNASNFADTGVELRSDEILVTRNDGAVLSLNRLSSDGDVIALVKDNSTVGRIGAFTGESYIGTRNTGFHFNDTGDQILPFDPQNVTYRDNGIDLGQSGYRWKNIWLSGAAYIGGTAAANALDDYEEGTFTPTIYGSSSAGTTTYSGTRAGSYTKIGNVVYIKGGVNWTGQNGTGSLVMGGLPFAAHSTAPYAQIFVFTKTITYPYSNPSLLVASNEQYAYLYSFGSGQQATNVSVQSAGTIEFTGFYLV